MKTKLKVWVSLNPKGLGVYFLKGYDKGPAMAYVRF